MTQLENTKTVSRKTFTCVSYTLKESAWIVKQARSRQYLVNNFKKGDWYATNQDCACMYHLSIPSKFYSKKSCINLTQLQLIGYFASRKWRDINIYNLR